MSERPKHQLAAVLFADIVGYTSLMQSDEQTALLKLQNFKLILEQKIPIHKGEIIQFYGDGCLVTFKDAIAALECAKSLQESFRKKPSIPVRIGLHEGEVIFKDNNVFGHAVNIASRVESMGIAGAILMSSDFRNKIKGNSAFQLEWLGKFSLKNVSDPMSIYAIANKGFPVPGHKEIGGKTIQLNANRIQKKFQIPYWLIPSLIIMVLGFFLWKTNKGQQLDTQILKERIAVLPFKNNTNDPNLEILGNMASDWINTGLMDVDEAEIVSPFTVRTHQAAIGILENDLENRPSFAQLTGAKNLITGAYYKNKDNLFFKMELVDALDGQLRFSFNEVSGKINQKEVLLTKLRTQVTGYWAARTLVDTKKITPPNFEAYELYLASLKKKGTEEELHEIITLDSTFYLARIHFLNVNAGSRFGPIKSHFDFLERHFNDLSEYEKAWFNYLRGLYVGEPMTSFNSLNKIRQKYPKDFLLNHSAAKTALNGLNNPTLALTIYGELPLEEDQATTAGIYWNERLLNMATCYIELGQLEEVNNLLATATPNPDIDNNIYIKTRLVEALASNNQEKVDKAYGELLATFQTKPFDYFWLNIELIQSNLLSDVFRRRQELDFVKNYELLPKNSINRLFARNFIPLVTNQGPVKWDDLKKYLRGMQIGNFAAAGQFYTNQRQPAKVLPIINELKKLTTCDFTSQVQYSCAAANYFIGFLQAQIGQTTEAIEYLKKAKALGLGNELHRFQHARYLQGLFDLPDFQKLYQPIWPDNNDGEVIVKSVYQYVGTPDNQENITANFRKQSQVKLETHDQFYHFKLGLTNNYNQQTIDYQYKLDNLDQEWLTAKEGEITVGNLPYGQQTLRVKAQFPDGRFTKEILEIPISVSRPFYLNPWFLAVLIGSIFLGAYFWPSQSIKEG